jgi:hypothetical protein
MKEYFNEAVEMGDGEDAKTSIGPDEMPLYEREFRDHHLAGVLGITDPAEQDKAIEIFNNVFVGAIRSLLLLRAQTGDPVEAAWLAMEAAGIKREHQKTALHRIYQDLEDPRPS